MLGIAEFPSSLRSSLFLALCVKIIVVPRVVRSYTSGLDGSWNVNIQGGPHTVVKIGNHSIHTDCVVCVKIVKIVTRMPDVISE